MFYVLGNVTFCGPQGQQNVIEPQNVKQYYVLRDPHLRFGSYAVAALQLFQYSAAGIRSGPGTVTSCFDSP